MNLLLFRASSASDPGMDLVPTPEENPISFSADRIASQFADRVISSLRAESTPSRSCLGSEPRALASSG
jgi:hypothetical protein